MLFRCSSYKKKFFVWINSWMTIELDFTPDYTIEKLQPKFWTILTEGLNLDRRFHLDFTFFIVLNLDRRTKFRLQFFCWSVLNVTQNFDMQQIKLLKSLKNIFFDLISEKNGNWRSRNEKIPIQLISRTGCHVRTIWRLGQINMVGVFLGHYGACYIFRDLWYRHVGLLLLSRHETG